MTKKERVYRTLQKETTDGIPSCFSLHFPADQAQGPATIKAHLDFQQATDCDIMKIMNENTIPLLAPLHCARDCRDFPSISMKSPFMERQKELTLQLLDACGDDVFTMGTLHGITTSFMYHPLRTEGKNYDTCRSLFTAWLREDEASVLDAFDRVTDGLCELARCYIELGVDSVFFASLGSEKRCGLTREEFSKWIEPYDKRILQAIQSAGGKAFLHICNHDLNMEYYSNYAPFIDAANWGIYEAPYTLAEGKLLFAGKPIMGGLPNRKGLWLEGSDEETKNEVERVLQEYGEPGFILGADCTLATEQDLSKVRVAVQAAREHKSLGEVGK